mgnify:FL=1
MNKQLFLSVSKTSETMFCPMCSTFKLFFNNIGKYLKDKDINFKIGKSEAGWVTRIIINKDIYTHNNFRKL